MPTYDEPGAGVVSGVALCALGAASIPGVDKIGALVAEGFV